MRRRVRFVKDDPYGLWQEGDEAIYLGRESEAWEAPYLFQLGAQTIGLAEPFRRGILVMLAEADCGFCHGRPVGNAASWLDGKPRGPVACPRCGGVP